MFTFSNVFSLAKSFLSKSYLSRRSVAIWSLSVVIFRCFLWIELPGASFNSSELTPFVRATVKRLTNLGQEDKVLKFAAKN